MSDPQWSPVMKTENTWYSCWCCHGNDHPSMEPGHEDREYMRRSSVRTEGGTPQWSPVMKTGNTGAQGVNEWTDAVPQWSPVMKTGNTCGRGYGDVRG